jgi:predicted ribosomally synthesized peptide with SipW-like signal peptide
MDSLSMSGGPTHSIAYFTDTNSVSGGDSEKLQTLSDFFNNI